MAVDSSPVVAGAPETGRRYRRLRAFNITVGVLLAAEAIYMLLASNDLALPVTAPCQSALCHLLLGGPCLPVC